MLRFSQTPNLNEVGKDELDGKLDDWQQHPGSDVPAFERYVTQLKTYYVDYQTFLPKSTRTQAVQGLYLLHLLSVDRIGEFHTELEVTGGISIRN